MRAGGSERPYNMYSREVNEGLSRNKRATLPPSPQARTCTLYLQSDPMLWDYVTKPQNQGGMGYVSVIVRLIVLCICNYFK